MGWEVAAASVRAPLGSAAKQWLWSRTQRSSGDIPYEFNYQVGTAIFLLLTGPVRVQAQNPRCHCGGGSGYVSADAGTESLCVSVVDVVSYLISSPASSEISCTDAGGSQARSV